MNPHVTALKHMMKLTCLTCDVCGLWYERQTVIMTKHYLTEIQILIMQYIDLSSWCVWQLMLFVKRTQRELQRTALPPDALLGRHHTERSKLLSGIYEDLTY